MGPWLLALSALATVAVDNIGIADKENTIAKGQKVYVPLAPVDPRSLMQGDYMRLRYTLPPLVDIDRREAGVEGLLGTRPYAVGRLDARGVVAWDRVEKYDTPIAPGSSGGGLFHADGHLLGIISFLTQGSAGGSVHFALSIDAIRAALAREDLRWRGRDLREWTAD